MIEEITKSLIATGLPGISVLALLYAVRTLYLRIDEIQEKRVTDSHMYAEKMADAAAIIRDNTAALQRLVDVSRRNGVSNE